MEKKNKGRETIKNNINNKTVKNNKNNKTVKNNNNIKTVKNNNNNKTVKNKNNNKTVKNNNKRRERLINVLFILFKRNKYGQEGAAWVNRSDKNQYAHLKWKQNGNGKHEKSINSK